MYQIVVLGLLISVVGGAMYFSYSNGSVDTVHSLYENAPEERRDTEESGHLEVEGSHDLRLEGFESEEPSTN